jgi:acyl carrier protein
VLSRVNAGASQGHHVHAHSVSESMLMRQPPSENISISPSQLPLLPEPIPTPISAPKGTSSSVNASAAQDAYTSIFNDICLLFERVADVPRANVKGNMSVEDLGMDSLMMLEVIRELSTQFSLDIPIYDMVELSDVDSLVSYLRKRGCATSSVMSSTSSFSPTPASTEPSTRSPIRPGSPGENSSDVLQQQQVDQLAKLLQEHLELEWAPSLDANLGGLGLDSLLAIELASDIEKLLSVSVDLYQIDDKSTFRDLLHLAGLDCGSVANTTNSTSHDTSRVNMLDHLPNPSAQIPQVVSPTASLPNVYEAFEAVRLTFDSISQEEGFTDFWRVVYPDQKHLVLSYITEAFKQLGCDLASLPANTPLPKLVILDKHKHLLERLYKILADGGYIDGQEISGYKRSSKPLELAASQVLLKETIAKFPLHASEHRLLDVTGSRLAECLTGMANPLSLLFANRTNGQVLADVYDVAPMCRAATRLLANFLLRAFSSSNKNETFHILEVGGGTGKLRIFFNLHRNMELC